MGKRHLRDHSKGIYTGGGGNDRRGYYPPRSRRNSECSGYQTPGFQGEGSLVLPNIYNKLVAAEEDLAAYHADVPTSQEQAAEESLRSDPPRNTYSIPVDMFVSPDSREEHIL